MEAGHGDNMADAADSESGFRFIVQLRAVTQQQGLGKGEHILRKAALNDVCNTPAESCREKADAVAVTRTAGNLTPLVGKEENTLALMVGAFLFPIRCRYPKAKFPADQVTGKDRLLFVEIKADLVGPALQLQGAIRCSTVGGIPSVVGSRDDRFPGHSVQRNGMGKIMLAESGKPAKSQRAAKQRPGSHTCRPLVPAQNTQGKTHQEQYSGKREHPVFRQYVSAKTAAQRETDGKPHQPPHG